MSLTHIETIELGSSQSSITFSSIPQDYDDLIVKWAARVDGPVNQSFQGQFNGDTGSNYSWVRLLGGGATVATDSLSTTYLLLGNACNTDDTANTFSNGDIYISNYTSSSNKSVSIDNVDENNGTSAVQYLIANLYTTTSPITSFQLVNGGGNNIIAGSTFSLYGVTAGGSGTVTTS